MLEALRFLQGLSFGFTVDEVLNGKPKTAASDVWEGLRGGSKHAGFKRPDGKAMRPSFHATLSCGSLSPVDYSITISAADRVVAREELSTNAGPVYETAKLKQDPSSRVLRTAYRNAKRLSFEASRPILSQLPRSPKCDKQDRALLEACSKTLGNIQRLDLDPRVLRQYSQGGTAERMGDRGENFAGVVAEIAKSKASKAAYLEWLQQLSPDPVDDVKTFEGAYGEALFGIRYAGRDFPAAALSDGTLRFAAIAAAFFQASMPSLLLIEEVETGVHPSRLRLLLDLLKSQAAATGTQVIVTTHSPALIGWLGPRDFDTVFLCRRKGDSGASVIHPLSDIRDIEEMVERQPIERLFAENWLESVL